MDISASLNTDSGSNFRALGSEEVIALNILVVLSVSWGGGRRWVVSSHFVNELNALSEYFGQSIFRPLESTLTTALEMAVGLDKGGRGLITPAPPTADGSMPLLFRYCCGGPGLDSFFSNSCRQSFHNGKYPTVLQKPTFSDITKDKLICNPSKNDPKIQNLEFSPHCCSQGAHKMNRSKSKHRKRRIW